MASTPSICDLCGKEADPVDEDCWHVVCLAAHADDTYHERCIHKFMRSMPGKNYDPSRRSGLPCPRGVGKATQYPNRCPAKVSHCQKIIVKSSTRAPPGNVQPAPAKPPTPKPKPAAKAPTPRATTPSAATAKPPKPPENTWVPSKPVVLEPAGPKPDPLGRNAAAAAAVSAKAAKKNAKRAAAKAQKREQEAAGGAGGGLDGSMSDTSSMAESGVLGNQWRVDVAGGGSSGGGAQGSGGVPDAAAEGLMWGDEYEDCGLDEDQLLLLELIKQQRQKQPHELLFHADTSAAHYSSSSSEEEEEEEEHELQEQHLQECEFEGKGLPSHLQGVQVASLSMASRLLGAEHPAGPDTPTAHVHRQHHHQEQQRQEQQQGLQPQMHSWSVNGPQPAINNLGTAGMAGTQALPSAAGAAVLGIQQQLAASSLAGHPPYPQHYPAAPQQQQQQLAAQQPFQQHQGLMPPHGALAPPAAVMGGYPPHGFPLHAVNPHYPDLHAAMSSNTSSPYAGLQEGAVYGGAPGLAVQAGAPPVTVAAGVEDEDCSDAELLALLMGS